MSLVIAVPFSMFFVTLIDLLCKTTVSFSFRSTFLVKETSLLLNVQGLYLELLTPDWSRFSQIGDIPLPRFHLSSQLGQADAFLLLR